MKVTRPHVLQMLGAAVLSGCGGGSAGGGISGSSFPPATEAALNAAITSWLGVFKPPGVVVGLWVPGRGTFVTTRGFSDAATSTPIQTADHFRIGSITKTFTVTVLLQLAGKQTVGLDDPVSKYLSYVPNGENITLRMLANMTSGLFSYSFDKTFQSELFGDPQRVWTPRELVDIAFGHEPDFTPGTGWSYCNTNTVLLGIVLEQVFNQPIGEIFAQNIFAPLGLQQTSWPTTNALPEPYAHGISEYNNEPIDPTNYSPSWAFTAGQMISNLADLRTWVKSYTTGSLISAAMQAQRLTWVTLPPNSPQRAYGLGIGMDHGWLGHTGELPGYNCAGYYLPAEDATLVIEVNSDNDAGGLNPAPSLFKAIATIVTPQNIPSG